MKKGKKLDGPLFPQPVSLADDGERDIGLQAQQPVELDQPAATEMFIGTSVKDLVLSSPPLTVLELMQKLDKLPLNALVFHVSENGPMPVSKAFFRSNITSRSKKYEYAVIVS